MPHPSPLLRVLPLACLLLPAALRAQPNVPTRNPTADPASNIERTDVLPRVLKQTPPVYPLTMRRYGITGVVTVEFIVDNSGKVHDAYPFESSSPEFEEAALTAVRQWTFAPGTKGGKAVNSRMRVSINFDLVAEDGRSHTRGGFTLESDDQSKLPPEMRYDTPPQLRNVLVPIYPHAQRRDNVRGSAKVAMLINPQGRVSEVRILSADQPEFGLALAAAAEGFTFAPAFRDKNPVPYRLDFEQIFSATEFPDETSARLLKLEKRQSDQIVAPGSLDTPLKPLVRRAPRHPLSIPSTTAGEATVEFLIDEQGRVRLPRIVSATEPAFGYAAVQAIAAWSFAPPKAGGKPAIVRARGPFRFIAAPAGETKAPAAQNVEAAAALFQTTDLDEQPKATKTVPPMYPAGLKENGIGGEVLIELVVDRTGKVRRARALRSSHPDFVSAAVNAIEEWTFSPGKISGHAVDTVLRQTVRFNVSNN